MTKYDVFVGVSGREWIAPRISIAERARFHGIDPDKFRRWLRKNNYGVLGTVDCPATKAMVNAYLQSRGEAPKYSAHECGFERETDETRI